MLARVHILLPYAFTVPDKETYPIYEYKIEEYRVRIFPPETSERADRYTDADDIVINGIKAFNADILRVDFQKSDFNRTKTSECDPPVELIKNVANDFLARLRYVANASNISLITFPSTSWDVTYLNDDETELPEEKGLVRKRGARKFQFSYAILNKDIWEDVHSLAPHQPLPVWKDLLLDADAILPNVGPAVVLTFTALEVFISRMLDGLAASGKVEHDLWAWINNRGYLKDPSIEERFDFLSRHLIGKSIKENGGLWEHFKHLRKARNSFVHDGVARVGDQIVTEDQARNFIRQANEIISVIKKELPEELRWPEFKHAIQIQFSKALGRAGGKGS